MGRGIKIGSVDVSGYAEGYLRLLSAVECMASWAGIDPDGLVRYFTPLRQGSEQDMDELDASTMMLQCAISLQNSGWMRNTVKLTAENQDTFAEALCDFVPARICFDLKNERDVLDALNAKGLAMGAKLCGRNGRPSNWARYANGILSAAEYLKPEGVESVNGAIRLWRCDAWNADLMSELPRCIARLKGFGPALALDFLKECGCLWASKPDTHVLHVLSGLADDEAGEMPIFGEEGTVKLMFDLSHGIREATGDTTVSPYKLDKLIWLASTGNFYLDGVHGHRDIAIRLLKTKGDEPCQLARMISNR